MEHSKVFLRIQACKKADMITMNCIALWTSLYFPQTPDNRCSVPGEPYDM